MINPKRVLLVDDDPGIRTMISAFLATTDYEITEADSAEAALRELSVSQKFDLAIIDFWLGKDHAIGIMDEIISRFHDLSIIIISGGNGSMDLEKTEAISDASGAVVFLQKPFRKADLVAAVASATE
ncbi:response regulator [Phaeobacter marinintestinus]|uniref:response regulator n=1 Tax=Falsiphaeobacter marinintestinus TaxID=1492905 RepID=UPI00164907AF|nr:response regulator [Phaeobacter marinintestinus]